MLSTGGQYAVKKRRKPVRKSPKLLPPEGAKSNPSKRHRDRLNQELSKLSRLLPFPEDVRARLDKLSILRLIVGYLKVKSYFTAALKDGSEDSSADPPMNPGRSEHPSLQVDAELCPEGDLLLQALDGFLVVVSEDGYVFYVSPTVQDYLGFHQSDVIHQSVFELIHKEDRALFQSQLLWPPGTAPIGREGEHDTHPMSGKKFLPLSGAPTDNPQHLPLEDPAYLERSFVCRFRCLLDNSSGFLFNHLHSMRALREDRETMKNYQGLMRRAEEIGDPKPEHIYALGERELNVHGHLKFLPGQNNRSEDGILESPQLTLFAIATPRQPLTILELQSKTVLFQTKHKLDFTPVACDSRAKAVLGYTDSELCRQGSGYQFIHAADATYCAENHVRMMRTGESGLTVFRLLTKRAGWLWVQSNARLVFRDGRPDGIVARQRALTGAEGEDHLRKRALRLPFTLATGEAILYESSLPGPLTALPASKRPRARQAAPTGQDPVCPASVLGAVVQEDGSTDLACIPPTPQGSLLERWGSHDKCEDKEEEDSSLLTLESLLEKDMEEEPNLCSTLQHLGVTNLHQRQWGQAFLRADADPAGPQNCCLLPPSRGRSLTSKREVLSHSSENVCSSLPACTTAPQTQKPLSSLDTGQLTMSLTMEVSPLQDGDTVPSCPRVHTQHFPTSGPALQSPLQWQLGHSPAAPLNWGVCKKPTVFGFVPLPKPLSHSQSAQLFQPSHTPSLPLGGTIPGHLAQPGHGNRDFCEESTHRAPARSDHSQEPLIASDHTSFVNPYGTCSLDSIWGFRIQGQPEVVPGQVGAGKGAGQAPPDRFSRPRSTMADPCLLWTGPASDIPPNLCRGRPLSVYGALGSPQHTPGSQEQPPHSLSGSPACPSQVLPHGPLATRGSYGADSGPVTKQQQWVQMGLQTQGTCKQMREGIPSVQQLGGCVRAAVPQAPQLSPLLSSESVSPGTGSSQGNSPAEPTRQSKNRLAVPAPCAVGRQQVQSSPALPPCPPVPAWPPLSTQGGHNFQQCHQNRVHCTMALRVPGPKGSTSSSKF